MLLGSTCRDLISNKSRLASACLCSIQSAERPNMRPGEMYDLLEEV